MLRPARRAAAGLGRAGRGRLSPGLRERALAAGWVLALAAAAAVTAPGPARADAVRDQQLWVLNAIHAPAAWAVSRGRGVTVAVIDSGVNAAVSDLAGSVAPGPNFSGVRTPRTDPHWGVHGTWMASLIAGHGHTGGSSGIIGVAPQSRVLSIRVVTDPGDPGYRHYQHEPVNTVQGALAKAIKYAVRHGAGVISMSLGYGAPSRPVRVAIQHALNAGVVVVASSGNSGGAASARRRGHAPYSFPADYPGVLGVAAVDQVGAPAGFSSDNLSVEAAAPGVRIPAQGRDGQYWLVSGTSPACALVAGVAALIKSRYPRLLPALVVQAMTASAQNRPPGGYDDRVGFGTVDAQAALTMAARLRHDLTTASAVRAGAHFGGGPAAVSAVPVAPRSRRPLVLSGLLALACLVFVTVLGVRRKAGREPPTGGGSPPGGPGGPPGGGDTPPAGGQPGSGWPPSAGGPGSGWPPPAGGPGSGWTPPAGGRPGGGWPPADPGGQPPWQGPW
jgi:subtilisin family serine protease